MLVILHSSKPDPEAFTVECVRSSRWLLGSCGRASTPWWKAVETVDKAKQLLFCDRLLFQFAVRKKQVKNISNARMGVEAWDQCLECCCLLGHTLDAMSKATGQACHGQLHAPCPHEHPKCPPLDSGSDGKGLLFEPATLHKTRRRAVEGWPGNIASVYTSSLWENACCCTLGKGLHGGD